MSKSKKDIEAWKEYRLSLLAQKSKSDDDFEKYITFIASGVLGLTITFADVANNTPTGNAYLNAHNKSEQLDPRHVSPNVTADPNTGHLYINKPHPVIPMLNQEKLINDLSH